MKRIYSEVMTVPEIKAAFPHQWVGLVEVKHVDNNRARHIISARVAICEADRSEITKAAINKEIEERLFTDDEAAKRAEIRGMMAARGRWVRNDI